MRNSDLYGSFRLTEGLNYEDDFEYTLSKRGCGLDPRLFTHIFDELLHNLIF